MRNLEDYDDAHRGSRRVEPPGNSKFFLLSLSFTLLTIYKVIYTTTMENGQTRNVRTTTTHTGMKNEQTG